MNFLSNVPAADISAHFVGGDSSSHSSSIPEEKPGVRTGGLSATSSWYSSTLIPASSSATSAGRGEVPFRQSVLLPQIKGVDPAFAHTPGALLPSTHTHQSGPFFVDHSEESGLPSSLAGMAAAQAGMVNEVMRGRKGIHRSMSSGSLSFETAASSGGGEHGDSSLSAMSHDIGLSLGMAATELPAVSASSARLGPQHLPTPASLWRSISTSDKRFLSHPGVSPASFPSHPLDTSLSSSTSSHHPARALGKGTELNTSISMTGMNCSAPKHGALAGKTSRRSGGILPPDCQYPHRSFRGTYYDILGLPLGASREQIVEKYRQWHVEGFRRVYEEDADRAEKEDCLIVEARNVLGNAKTRQEYDSLLQDSGFSF